MIDPRELKGVATAQLVEALLHRLATQLAVEGDVLVSKPLSEALAALAALPAVRCDRCTKRCALDFLDVTEIKRNPVTAEKTELRYTACPSCYKEANK